MRARLLNAISAAYDRGAAIRTTPRTFGLVVLAVAGILAARTWTSLVYPSLAVEDGTAIFADFYQHRHLGHVLRFKVGYLSLIANLIAFVTVRLPAMWIPHTLAGVPFAFTIASCASIALPAFRAWIPSDAQRILIALALALNPVGDFLLVAHTDYGTWTTLLLLVLWSLVPLSSRDGPALAHVAALLLLAWSHPLAIVVLPFYLLGLFRADTRRLQLLYALLLTNLALHQLEGVDPVLLDANVTMFDPEHRRAWLLFYVRAFDALDVLTRNVVFRSVFGDRMANHVTELYPAMAYAFLGVVLAAARATWQQTRKVVVSWAYVSMALTFLSVVIRPGGVQAIQGSRPIDLTQRYVYVQGLLFTAVLLHVLLVWGAKHGRHAVAAISLAAVAFFGFRSVEQGDQYASKPEEGLRIRAFFAELDACHREGRSGVRLRLERDPPIWSIDVVTR